MGGPPDVLRAEVERPHIAPRLVTTRLERVRAAARLNELLSRGPEEPLGTPIDPGPAPLPGPLARLLALAREHHPELAVRGAAVAREKDDVALARRSYLPDFDLTFERFDNRVGRDGYGAMIAMTLPLPFKYRRDAALDEDRKSTRLNSSHGYISYAVFCLKKKKNKNKIKSTKKYKIRVRDNESRSA